MPSVLFVCTANRFRSPIAAAWFSICLQKEADLHDWHIGSAGTWAEAGQTVFPSANWVNERFGLDLGAHRSQRINKDLMARYDLILVMESNHREALWVEFPETKGHLFLLSEVATGLTYDITDPGMQSGDTFHETATELRDLIGKGCGNICRLARQLHGISGR
jgi:protein-tyrosine-phosphatase